MPDSFSLVYGTNIWSHHQAPIAFELAKLLPSGDFHMALFEPVRNERIQLGWTAGENLPWVLGPPRDESDAKSLSAYCREADVMVFGACPREILEARAAAGKLTMVASERLLKRRHHRLRTLDPRYSAYVRSLRVRTASPVVHALAIGYYAPHDLRVLKAFDDRVWKWGYFTEVGEELPQEPANSNVKVLWVGRMLKWKRVDLLLRALASAKDSGIPLECTIVGTGPEKDQLVHLSERLRLGPECLVFRDPIAPELVRQKMRESDIYVLSSDRGEGWGAVAGEAMAEGCVLIANEQAGAARELIVDGVTGFLFRDGDVGQLASLLIRVGSDADLRMRVRASAWNLVNTVWSPSVAAERVVTLCRGLLGLGPLPHYLQGPCSRVHMDA